MPSTTIDINIPEMASKRIKITQYENKRKVQISSNLLPLNGFEKGVAVIETSLGDGEGYKVELAGSLPYTNIKRIYSRDYSRRKNNPTEVVFETSAKRILDASIPKGVEFVHVVMTHGLIVVKPLLSHIKERLNRVLKAINPFTVFAACSAGVDIHAAKSVGYEINSLIEYRPQESRDKRDLTEIGVISAIGNVPVKHVFNEDITLISTDHIYAATLGAPSTCFTISLQCDDFSSAKSNSFKDLSISNLSSSLDMAYDGLRIIHKMLFPVVILEQVANFAKSDIAKMWDLRLRKLGYSTHQQVVDARDHDGLTSRVRFFHVATLLPSEFNFPQETPRREVPIWDEFIAPIIDDLRDISHTSSMKKGLACGRLRAIKKDSLYSGSVLKSNSRQAKDSLVVMTDDNKILFPNEQLLKTLMSIPDGFKTHFTNAEQASEIIGQSVDYSYYQKLMIKVKEHIQSYINSVSPMVRTN